MHVLQQLRFGGRWITAKQDIYLAAETASSRLTEVLAAAAEQLAEDSLLNVVVLPNRRSQRVDQLVVNLRARGKIVVLFLCLLRKVSVKGLIKRLLAVIIVHFFIGHRNIVVVHVCFFVLIPFRVSLSVTDHVNISAIDRLLHTHVRI